MMGYFRKLPIRSVLTEDLAPLGSVIVTAAEGATENRSILMSLSDPSVGDTLATNTKSARRCCAANSELAVQRHFQ